MNTVKRVITLEFELTGFHRFGIFSCRKKGNEIDRQNKKRIFERWSGLPTHIAAYLAKLKTFFTCSAEQLRGSSTMLLVVATTDKYGRFMLFSVTRLRVQDNRQNF